MALDCASLALGLIAGVLLKHPVNSSGKYPFGLRNFEILAGFANGTLLVGISGSIIFEAFGRLFNPVSLQQTTELIVVSILGLLVNVVSSCTFLQILWDQ
ncbi:CIC11C00000004847 [Sungouiella intermedia]|uniref:Zinc transporter n=1 Tax=Sungouiella intermedia TaxID=45354 RepID=A0A1L0D521_9ASCO|nr:CIC11C00000004847 [[Candida] intermedia]